MDAQGKLKFMCLPSSQLKVHPLVAPNLRKNMYSQPATGKLVAEESQPWMIQKESLGVVMAPDWAGACNLCRHFT